MKESQKHRVGPDGIPIFDYNFLGSNDEQTGGGGGSTFSFNFGSPTESDLAGGRNTSPIWDNTDFRAPFRNTDPFESRDPFSSSLPEVPAGRGLGRNYVTDNPSVITPTKVGRETSGYLSLVPENAPDRSYRDRKTDEVRYYSDPKWYDRLGRGVAGFFRGPDFGNSWVNKGGRYVAGRIPGASLPYSIGGAVQAATSNDPVSHRWRDPEEEDPRNPDPNRAALQGALNDPSRSTQRGGGGEEEGGYVNPFNGGYVPPSQRNLTGGDGHVQHGGEPDETPPSAGPTDSPLPTVVPTGGGTPPVTPATPTPPTTPVIPRGTPYQQQNWANEVTRGRDLDGDGWIGQPNVGQRAAPEAPRDPFANGNDPNIQGGHGTPAGPQTPPPSASGTQGLAALKALYNKYYGRDPTPGEIQASIANVGGLPAIEAALAADTKNLIPGAPGGPPLPPKPQTPAPQTGAGSGGGGYSYLGFDFGQDPANRDIGKSAKYAFSYFAGQAASKGIPQPRNKQEAQAWFEQHIAPGMNAQGFTVHKVVGDKAFISTREVPGGQWVDFQGNSGGQGDQPLTWQAENTGQGADADAEALYAVTNDGGGGGASGMDRGANGLGGVLDTGNPALNSFAGRLIQQLLEGAALDDVLEREQRRSNGIRPETLALVGF